MPAEIEVKSILNKKKERDAWFLDDYSVNLYSSCQFNCLYCYIRGSKYGQNLESSLSVKINAIELLDRQLFNRAKKNQQGVVVLSSATDPYVQIDKSYQLTRQALELLLKYRFPVHLITKSPEVERDFDLLHEIDKQAILPPDLQGKISGTTLTFSFSTLDDTVGKIFEPGAPLPSDRLKGLVEARKEGFRSGVSLMPLLPGISDTDESLEGLYTAFSDADAQYIMPAGLTLFGYDKASSKVLVFNAISKHFPELKDRYEELFAYGFDMTRHEKFLLYEKLKNFNAKFGIPDRIIP